ncbi:transcriptional regulator [Thermogymnomonas acidicola]|uniref:Transcriptional regulator n=1 Tax=Thermogymnomonas acidicola TaxID=399579 RepID=A0AA37FBY7_9ARCH|nr:Lrp/AsnC family transcriptional regulator [Thermogymnomonas acidicola]GGM77606.1 transcriptional regulator [Thermogymnomonas acidicola]
MMWEKALEGKLDDIDIRIVNMLLEDGRMSDKEMADQLHLSKTAVRMRRMRLQRLGYIKFVGLLVLQNIELEYADVLVRISARAEEGEIQRLIEQLTSDETIYEVTEYLGGRDLLVRMFDRNKLNMKRHLQKIMRDNSIVESIDVLPAVRSYKAWGVKLNHSE